MSYKNWTKTSKAYQNYITASEKCAAAFAKKAEPTTVKPQLGKPWSGYGCGPRQYVQNIEEIIDLEISRYKSGNISGASLGNETISNSQGNNVLSMVTTMKMWIDMETGTVHHKYNPNASSSKITHEEIIESVTEAIYDHGLATR